MRFFLGYNERQAMLSAENEFPRRGMEIAENRKEFHMITLERTSVMNLENAIRGARNPMNSWGRMDSGYNEYFSALDKINDYDYDCVLLDIMLPGGSGLDLLRELKRT